jgi:hypothetical protein
MHVASSDVAAPPLIIKRSRRADVSGQPRRILRIRGQRFCSFTFTTKGNAMCYDRGVIKETGVDCDCSATCDSNTLVITHVITTKTQPTNLKGYRWSDAAFEGHPASLLRPRVGRY